MDAIVHLIVLLAKIGLGAVAVVMAIVLLAYAIEARCINPMGCRNTAADAQADENDRILHSKQWGRDWGS